MKRPQVERNPREGQKLVQYINYNLNLKLLGLIGSVILITLIFLVVDAEWLYFILFYYIIIIIYPMIG